jgi:endo-1,4-beta-xylanase
MLNVRRIGILAASLAVLGCDGKSGDAQNDAGAPAGSGGQTAVTSEPVGDSSGSAGTTGESTSATGGTTPTSTAAGGTSSKPETGGKPGAGGTPATSSSSSSTSTSPKTPDAGTPQPSDAGTPTPGKKFVGNISSSGGRTDVGSLKFATYWNQVSPQNEGKWGSVSNAKGQYNWSSLDTLYKYAQTNNMVFKQHTFMWGAQQPNYDITEADVKDWMTQFCKRYPDVALIDVVNEPPPHTTPKYANNIGGGTNGDWAWIANAFKWAREACPNAVLILNDFNNLEWDKDSQHFIDIVTAIKKLGAPIDAIGCQAHDLDHMGSNGSVDVTFESVKTRLANLIATIPNIYITEMDISTKDDALQLSLYKQHFQHFWDNPSVKGITIWGWVVGQTWSMAPDSGLITSSGTKRPAFTWLLETIGK